MELSNFIEYERLFVLELRNPLTDAPLGIVFQIRSAGSAEAKAVLRKHADKNLARLQKNKLVKSSDLEEQELEKAASYIASWDWGEHTWHGEKPKFSMEKAIEIMKDASWIYAQVVEVANDIANFTTK